MLIKLANAIHTYEFVWGVSFCHQLLLAVQNRLCNLEEEGNGYGFSVSITVQVLEMLRYI